MRARMGFKNMSAVAKALGVSPSALTRITYAENDVSPGMVMRIHTLTGWPVEEIQKLAGIAVSKTQAPAASGVTQHYRR